MRPNIKVCGKKISLNYELKAGETYYLTDTKKGFTLNMNKKPIEVIGFSSMTEDSKHIILLDYDTVAKWIVEADIKKIQEQFSLTPFYCFTTKEKVKDGVRHGNYHLVCLTKKTANEVFEIQRTTHCDFAYQTMPLRNVFRSWVIRTSNKGKRQRPKYLSIMGTNTNLNNEVSSAHLELLRKLYGVPNINYEKEDGLKKIWRNVYETINY